jgi:hypothetical protein
MPTNFSVTSRKGIAQETSMPPIIQKPVVAVLLLRQVELSVIPTIFSILEAIVLRTIHIILVQGQAPWKMWIQRMIKVSVAIAVLVMAVLVRSACKVNTYQTFING